MGTVLRDEIAREEFRTCSPKKVSQRPDQKRLDCSVAGKERRDEVAVVRESFSIFRPEIRSSPILS